MKKSFVLAIIAFLLFLSVPQQFSYAHSLDQDELNHFLVEIDFTEEELENYLFERWDYSLDYFESVDELIEWLSPVLTDTDIEELLAGFNLSYEEFLVLLDETGFTLDYFIFYDDLLYFLFTFVEFPEPPDFSGFLTEFSLSWEEEAALINHMYYIYETKPNVGADLSDLQNRALAFDGFESIRELSAADVAELFSIGEKAIDVLDLNPDFYLDAVGKEKKPIDYKTLISGEAIKGYDLLVELYDNEGTFLADFYITAEMFNSHFVKTIVDDVNTIGKEVEEAIKNPQPEAKPQKENKSPAPSHENNSESTTDAERDANGKVTKTAAGAKMPNTATNYPLYILLGFGLMVSGIILSRRVFREKKAA